MSYSMHILNFYFVTAYGIFTCWKISRYESDGKETTWASYKRLDIRRSSVTPLDLNPTITTMCLIHKLHKPQAGFDQSPFFSFLFIPMNHTLRFSSLSYSLVPPKTKPIFLFLFLLFFPFFLALSPFFLFLFSV